MSKLKLYRVEIWVDYTSAAEVVYDGVSECVISDEWLKVYFPDLSYGAFRMRDVARYRVTPHE